MDLVHGLLLTLMGFVLGLGVMSVVLGFLSRRLLKKDEAIDAATFLALRDLRERFERTK